MSRVPEAIRGFSARAADAVALLTAFQAMDDGARAQLVAAAHIDAEQFPRTRELPALTCAATADEVAALGHFRAMAANKQEDALAVLRTLATRFPRQRPALTLVSTGASGGAR